MGNTNDYPAPEMGGRQAENAQSGPDRESFAPTVELTAIADGLGSLTRSAQMLSINAAIAASRSGSAAPEIAIIAQEIKRVAAELESLTKRLGRQCA